MVGTFGIYEQANNSMLGGLSSTKRGICCCGWREIGHAAHIAARTANSAVTLLLAVFAFSADRPAVAVDNPYYNIKPELIFPDKWSLLPHGSTYSVTVPDTLDLSTRADWYIKGAVQTITPSLHDAPGGAVLRAETNFYDCSRGGESHSPCIIDSTPNWGKTMRALTEARQMSAYDRTDGDHTLETQHRMMSNMLDYDVTIDLLQKGFPGLVYPNQAITPNTVTMQAMMTEWQHNPSSELSKAIGEMQRMHVDKRVPVAFGSTTYQGLYFTSPNPSKETFIGYLGDYWTPFVQGKALRTLSERYLQTGDPVALSMSNDLAFFLRSSPIWENPDPARFPTESGQFVGHIHSWLQAAMGLATHAEALRKTNPQSGLANAELQLADQVYNFVKRRTRAGKVGNFGESGSTGDMAILGIKLTEQNVAYYYDEVEAWTRNAMAEMQIDEAAAQYIQNNSNDLYEHSNIGTKVTGLFFADGTHVPRIPFGSAGFTVDYPSNTFSGMYEVWNKTVEYKGNFAQVNFGLNRASTYLDVESDLPYRGEIRTNMKSDIGPIESVGVRVPDWADLEQVSVVETLSNGTERTLSPEEWSWVAGSRYVQISEVQPDTSYSVKFPIEVYTETIYEMRSANRVWYEGSYPSPSAGSPETVIAYTGTFRGNTLVDISPRPSGGFPRYQRAYLANLPPTDVAPPEVTLTRFVASAALLGDYNNDGVVDAADYTVWRDGNALQNEGASFGVIDQADYELWRRQFGKTRLDIANGSGQATAAVPEPTSMVLLVVAIQFGLLQRSRATLLRIN
jgi:hypothetical protein